MKTPLAIQFICIFTFIILAQTGLAQRIDYQAEGCKATVKAPSINSYSLQEHPLPQPDSEEIWQAMETLALSMIDLEVEVIQIRELEISLIPFQHVSEARDWEDEDHNPISAPEMEEIIEDRMRYELLQMKNHLLQLNQQVQFIKSEVHQFQYYRTRSATQWIDERATNNNPIAGSKQFSISNTSKEVWKELEEMAIQALELEIEVSDLRLELAVLKRNTWEIDQVASLKTQVRN